MYTVKRIICSFILFCVIALSGNLRAEAQIIGLSLPLSGDAAELGREFRAGANLAMEKYGDGYSLFIVDDGCDPDLATLAMSDLKKLNPLIVTGFLCNEVAIKGANTFRDTDIPILVAGARSVRLIKDREREEWDLWRLAPGDDYAYLATANIIENRWKNTPFSIIDDGTIFGRTFTDGLRLMLNETNVQPQTSDNFRSAQSTQAGLIRRMKRSGITAAFIASAAHQDLQTVLVDRQKIGLEVELILSEQMAILPFLEEANQIAPGTLVIMQHYPQTQERIELDALLSERGIVATSQIYRGYQAIQVALKALASNPNKPQAFFQKGPIETVLGEVKFDEQGANVANPYKLHRWNGSALELVSDKPPATQ